MDDADLLSLLTVVLCLVGSMFFSGSETAITAFDDRRAQRIKEQGGSDGKAIAQWVDRPVFVLTTILLGNNVTNTLMGAVATALAIRHLGESEYGAYAVPLAVVGTTALLLVFGEIVPKAIGRIYRNDLALNALRILNVFGRITYPAVVVLTRITERVIAKAAKEDETSNVTAGELGYLVKVAEREGTIRAEQAAMLQGVFRFEDKIVRDIMVPVDKVTAVDVGWSLARIKSFAAATGHSRMPVYEGDIDEIRGVLHIKQLVGIDDDKLSPEELGKLLRPPFFVSESLLVHDLLRRFKETRVHLAIVVDDAGDTVGVVTLEDVLEQIVGQIFDETDRAPAARAVRNDGVHYLDGQDALSAVEETFEIEFEEFDGVDSIGDLLTRLAGEMPVVGSVFVVENVRFKVLSADPKRVIRVSATRVEAEMEEQTG